MIKIKYIAYRMLMMIMVVIIAYCFGELIIYTLYKKEIALFPRYVTGVNYNDFKIRRNVPNAEYKHKSVDDKWEFRINRAGFRSDIEYAYNKPPDVTRILVLGDSYTMGHEVNQEETYSVILEEKLKAKGISAQVINAGVSGFSNSEELVFYEQEGIKYSPDILIVGFYNNDIRDNIRAALYKLENDNLVLSSKTYQPYIKSRDFLNSFFIYRWLSENSYLHNYLNTVATKIAKRSLAKKNLKSMAKNDSDVEKLISDTREITPPDSMANRAYDVQLTCEIIKKIQKIADEHNTILILLDVALDIESERPNLYDSFPKQCIEKGVVDYYVKSSELLKQYKGSRDELYRPHGKHHWTDVSHSIVGNHLSEIIPELILKNKENQN